MFIVPPICGMCLVRPCNAPCPFFSTKKIVRALYFLAISTVQFSLLGGPSAQFLMGVHVEAAIWPKSNKWVMLVVIPLITHQPRSLILLCTGLVLNAIICT